MRHAQLTNELQEQASLYAAGALPEGERVEYARHLEDDQCAVCRDAVNELQSVATLLAYAAPPATPSAGTKARLMEQARRSALVQQERRPDGRRWFEWITGAAAAAALIALLVVVQTNRDLRRQADELSSRVAQLEVQLAQQRSFIATVTTPQNRVVDLAGQGQTISARGRIFWDQQQGPRWLFYVRDLPKLPDDKVYQLWFVPKSGNPISAIAFNTEANGTKDVEIMLPPGLPDLKAAAVTIEPAPGVPQPTGTFALLGATE
jgi:anti-sigma-K factor RskA